MESVSFSAVVPDNGFDGVFGVEKGTNGEITCDRGIAGKGEDDQ